MTKGVLFVHHTDIQESFNRPDGSLDPAVTQTTEVLGSNLGRWIFFIEVVHIYMQYSKLFKRMGCAVLSMVLYAIIIRVGHIPDFGLPSVVILLDCAGIEVDIHSLINKMN